MEEKCFGCACEIKRGVAQRRKLYSPSNCHVLPVMTGMMRELYCSEDVDLIFPAAESDRSKEEIYICIKCFRHLEKAMKLEKQIKEVHQTLKTGFMKVSQCVQLRLKSDVSSEANTSPTSTRKRSRMSSPLTSPSSKKQRRSGPDTPTRRIVQQIHAPGTPSVSVSL